MTSPLRPVPVQKRDGLSSLQCKEKTRNKATMKEDTDDFGGWYNFIGLGVEAKSRQSQLHTECDIILQAAS